MMVQKNPGMKWGFPQGMNVTPEAHLPSEYQILPLPESPTSLPAEDCSVHLCTGSPPPPGDGINCREKRADFWAGRRRGAQRALEGASEQRPPRFCWKASWRAVLETRLGEKLVLPKQFGQGFRRRALALNLGIALAANRVPKRRLLLAC